MLYILEGLPGGGKTSIISSLKAKHKIPAVDQIIYHDQYSDEPLNYYLYSDLMKYRNAGRLLIDSQKVIMDRGYISSLAYNYSSDRLLKSGRYSKAKNIYHKFDSVFNFEIRYLLIDVNIEDSIKRKRESEQNDYIWYNKGFLSYMKEFYEKEILNFVDERHIKRIGNNLSLSDVFGEVERFIYGAE
ncbi:MAG: hypothetical protein WC178_05260 [Candidatus Paceibacterota bacterium]